MFLNITLTRYTKGTLPESVVAKFNTDGFANHIADIKPHRNTLRVDAE